MATKLVQIDNELTELRIEVLKNELEEAQALLLSQRVPEEPAGESRVIRFSKYGNTYCFAAIKVSQGNFASARWYVTQDGSRSSRQGHPAKTWGELLSWIGERNWDKIEVLS
jgi:hypothetical protein